VPNTYSYATLTDALNQLASRLFDPTFQQWTQAELTGYIREALRTWNALTSFWRAEMAFPLTNNAWWYDLRAQPGTLIPYTVTKYEMVSQLENHLLEPPTPAAWSGSGQFSLQDLNTALQRRQDDTLGATAVTVNRSLVNAPIQTRVVLPDNTIDLRRVVWLPTPPTSGPRTPNKILRQSDRWAERAFQPLYTVAGPQAPSNWMQNTEPPPSFDVDAVPNLTGSYEVLTVNAGPVWLPGTDGALTVPDDWTWVFKWGALWDLLSRESNSKDSIRAEYCKRRYLEGLSLMENAPTTLALRLNNIPMGVDAVRNGDDFNPSWMGIGLTWAEVTETWNQATFTWASTAGIPNVAYSMANLLAFGPAPSVGANYSATVSLVQNAPVPMNPGDFIQVSRDDFDTIIDYAHHLAMFKAGGAEFLATVTLYTGMEKKAAWYNGKLKEMGFFSMDQLEIGTWQESRSPRYAVGTGPAAES
jgi:hypothetical protein